MPGSEPSAISGAVSSMDPLPRLRSLEILRLGEEEGSSYLLRDPEGYSDEELVLSEPALFVAAHADGKHTFADLQGRFERRYGKVPAAKEVEVLLDRLDTAFMLENETFFRERDRRHREFREHPVRAAVHGDASYPGTEAEAEAAVSEFFEKAAGLEEDGPRPEGTLRGLIAPHIDLRVGGPCTALTYRELVAAPRVKTVFVLGTAHGCPQPAWITLDKPFESPLGQVPVDEEACRRLIEAGNPGEEQFYYHRKEHSIEFQALFLSKLRREGRDLRLVPVLCGSLRTETPGGEGPAASSSTESFIRELTALLAERGDEAVLVAAADLAHVGVRFGDAAPLEERHLALLEKKDRATLDTVARGDSGAFFSSVTESGDPRRICGLAPIYGLLSALEGVRGKVLKYEQAVDPTGTVTYAAMGLWG